MPGLMFTHSRVPGAASLPNLPQGPRIPGTSATLDPVQWSYLSAPTDASFFLCLSSVSYTRGYLFFTRSPAVLASVSRHLLPAPTPDVLCAWLDPFAGLICRSRVVWEEGSLPVSSETLV